MGVPTFVDLQGFIVNGRFTVKEAAILQRGTILNHYVFEQPTSWQSLSKREKRSVHWLTNNHHHLRWTDGFVPYSKVEILLRAALDDDPPSEAVEEEETSTPATIYVKGLEKSLWFRDIVGETGEGRIEAIELRYSDIARISKIADKRRIQCDLCHPQCAMTNVFKLHDWWISQTNNDDEKPREEREA